MNTDRALVLEFLESGRKPTAVTSNPLAEDLGATLLGLDTNAGTALLAFDPPARFAQGAGVLQGGIIATLLDFAMAFAAHAALAARDCAFATANLSVSLLRPAPPGRYLARARVLRAGRTLLFAEATLVPAPDGGIVATATGVMPITGAS